MNYVIGSQYDLPFRKQQGKTVKPLILYRPFRGKLYRTSIIMHHFRRKQNIDHLANRSNLCEPFMPISSRIVMLISLDYLVERRPMLYCQTTVQRLMMKQFGIPTDHKRLWLTIRVRWISTKCSSVVPWSQRFFLIFLRMRWKNQENLWDQGTSVASFIWKIALKSLYWSRLSKWKRYTSFQLSTQLAETREFILPEE